jgi:ABC-type glycerol-3-phosphate transport system substrate-binding protein
VPAGQSRQPATIEWYKFLNPPQVQQAPQFLAEFQAAQPQITVKLTVRPGGAPEYLPQLLTMVAGGQPPAVLQISESAYAAVTLGLAQDISDLFKRDRLEADRLNQLLFQYSSQWQGKSYGLPFATQAGAMALIYNRQHLAGAGVAEPPEKWNTAGWTWEKLVEDLKRLVKVGPDGKTAVHGINNLGNWPWAPQSMWGGTWVKDDYKTIVCDTQEVTDAYQAFADLRLRHRVWPQVGETSDFRQQTSAFSALSAFNLLEYANLPAEVDWAFVPIPAGGARVKASPQAYLFDHKIARGSAQREAAWTFMRWLAERSRLAVFEGRPPALKEDVPRWTAEIFKGRPNVRTGVLADALNQAQRPELLWLHPKWASDMSDLLTKEFWDPVFAGQKQVPAALREMKPRLQQIAGS